MSVSIVNAGQVLRPAEDGRSYLRRAEFRDGPGAVAVRDGRKAVLGELTGSHLQFDGAARMPCQRDRARLADREHSGAHALVRSRERLALELGDGVPFGGTMRV